jgi:hypothetical protein
MRRAIRGPINIRVFSRISKSAPFFDDMLEVDDTELRGFGATDFDQHVEITILARIAAYP